MLELLSRKKSRFAKLQNQVRDLPFFPVVPIVPLTLLVGAVALSIIALVSVRRLGDRLEG